MFEDLNDLKRFIKPNTCGVYLIRCESEVFYIGMTADLKTRIKRHMRGTGSKVTRKFKPISYDICLINLSRIDALDFESRLVHNFRMNGLRAYGGGHTQI